MTVSLNIRRTGVLLVVVLGALAVVGSAQSGVGQGIPPQSAIDAASANWAAKARLLDINGRPQFDRLPPQSAIDAASANWAAKARLLDINGRPQFDRLPPQSAIDAASANWAAKAKLLDINGRPQFDRLPPQSAIDAASANWAAKAELLDINGRPVSSVAVSDASGSTGFDRRDFGMGAGAMLGLVLISGGVFAGVHFSRRSTVRTHPS